MGFENMPSLEEKEPIKVTKEEFEKITSYKLSDEQRVFLEEKGIKINSGEVVIEVDGREETITTREDDFGTVISHEGGYGQE